MHALEFSRRRFALLSVLLIAELGLPRAACASCESAYEKADIHPLQIQQRIDKLPPLRLDYPSVVVAFKKLMDDLGSLRAEFSKTQEMESQLEARAEEAARIRSESESLERHYALQAEKILDHASGSEKDRKLLEGYRILMRSCRRVAMSAEKLLKESPRFERYEESEEEMEREPRPDDESPQESQRKSEKKPSNGGDKKSSKNGDGTGNESADAEGGSGEPEQGESGETAAGEGNSQEPGAPQNGAREDSEQKAEPGKLADAGAREKGKPEERATDDPVGSANWSATWTRNLMDQLWTRALREYGDFDKLLSAIGSYRDLCHRLSKQYPGVSYLEQDAKRADRLSRELQLNDARDELGMRGARHWREILGALSEVSSLTPEESAANEQARKLMAASQGTVAATDRQLGLAALSAANGPLSQKSIVMKYSTTGNSGDLDWTRFAADIRAGQWNDLLQMKELDPYLDIVLANRPKPFRNEAHRGKKTGVSQSSPELSAAREFDQIQHFYRDGAPLSQDFLRVLSGDMLMKTYREPVTVPDPVKPKHKIVTIVLRDRSKSTEKDRKNTVLNLLTERFVDRSQAWVVSGEGEHVIYNIPFNEEIDDFERIAGLEEAYRFFERNRRDPLTPGGSTRFERAINHGLDLIAGEIKKGGEIGYANILLLNDGDEVPISIQRVLAHRAQIPADVRVVFNNISVGEENSELKRVASEALPPPAGWDGASNYHFIPLERVRWLTGDMDWQSSLGSVARGFDDKSNSPPAVDSAKFREKVVGLKSVRDVESRLSSKYEAEAVGWLGSIRGSPDRGEFDQAIDLFERIASQGGVERASASERAQFFVQYIRSVVKSLPGSSPESFLARVGEEKVKWLKSWIGLGLKSEIR